LTCKTPSQHRSGDDPQASTDTICPHCGTQIEPKDYKRVDWEHLECPQYGKQFIPGERYPPKEIESNSHFCPGARLRLHQVYGGLDQLGCFRIPDPDNFEARLSAAVFHPQKITWPQWPSYP